jgi:hypothetical protein
MLSSCANEKQKDSLPETFIESLIQQKIELLEPYFPTIEFHKSLERNGTGQSDSAAMNFVEASNLKLKENWTKIIERIRSDNIDLSKLKIEDTISAQPFWSKKISKTVVLYSYENKTWDDMVFIVGELNGKQFLLEIPEPENVFSMKDTSLAASKAVRFENEMRSPEFKKSLQDRVDKIISYAKANKVKEFSEYIHYPEADPASVGGNPELISAGLMEKINNIMSNCDKPVYGDVNSLDLPEGKWIVIQMKCSDKFIHFAFISINNQLLLNDVDAAGLR